MCFLQNTFTKHFSQNYRTTPHDHFKPVCVSNLPHFPTLMTTQPTCNMGKKSPALLPCNYSFLFWHYNMNQLMHCPVKRDRIANSLLFDCPECLGFILLSHTHSSCMINWNSDNFVCPAQGCSIQLTCDAVGLIMSAFHTTLLEPKFLTIDIRLIANKTGLWNFLTLLPSQPCSDLDSWTCFYYHHAVLHQIIFGHALCRQK